MAEDEVVAAGGWCAPTSAVYDALQLRSDSLSGLFPVVRVGRGGLHCEPLTPSEAAAAEAVRAMVARWTKKVAAAVDQAIDDAVLVAMANGWDLHLHVHPDLAWRSFCDTNTVEALHRIGIEFTPAKHVIPTIHHHRDDATWDEDD